MLSAFLLQSLEENQYWKENFCRIVYLGKIIYTQIYFLHVWFFSPKTA